MIYLLSKAAPKSRLYPTDDLQAQARVDAILNLDVGTIGPGFLQRTHAILHTGLEAEDWVRDRAEDNLKCLNRFLATRKYVAGDHLTLADISLVHTLTVSEALEDDFTDFVHLSEYLVRVREELGEAYRDVNAGWTEKMRDFLTSKKIGNFLV